uniref:Ubiquitin carboxyl-terminal hydrolase n=1 Tax=Astyanax mexicanus TaxID=7994 RepID=A0A8B9LHC2_ASTMX
GDQNSPSFPGQIDNTELFENLETYRLKERLVENEDFVLVPAEAWRKLLSWYGMVPEQPALERKVIDLPSTVKVEIYPVEISLCLHSNMEEVVTEQFSRTDTICKVMQKQFEVEEDAEPRLWMKSSDTSCERLRNTQMTVLDTCLATGMTVIMELRNADGTWPSSRPQIMNSVEEQDTYRGQPGVCGLTNLGNTCFMNSALQCLSNTPPLTEYFLKNLFLGELNFTNPLGMKGEIAEAYADVIKQMWSGRHYSVVPRIFKTKVGHFASQFLGYQQHDSQELLSFLLDGLHEDLNRVKNKEYIELRDADGRPDQEVAEEAWRNHRRRNDSVIVDTFHGLFKSTLVCPECQKVSVTFDPFCYLSVPLPISKERVMEVFFVSLDPLSKPVQHRVVVPKAGKVIDLCTALSQATNIPMVVADVFNHRFYKIYQVDESLSCILDRDDIFEAGTSNRVEQPQENTHDVTEDSEEAGTSNTVEQSQENTHGDEQNNAQSEPGSNGAEEEKTEEEESSSEQDRGSSTEEGQSAGGSTDTNSQDAADGERRCAEKKQKPLFIIQAVNSNGTTERGMADGGNTLSLTDQILMMPCLLMLLSDLYNSCVLNFIYFVYAQRYDKDQSMKVPQQHTTVQLQECIELFTTVETLEEENPWYCPTCKKHQLATKKLDLWSLPEVLIIHLKRFSYTKYSREKLDSIVEFPLRCLDFSGCLLRKTGTDSEPPSRYDLIAVSNHYGGLRDGHYTSYAQNKDNGRWYYFDDSKVTCAKEEQIVVRII